MGRGAEPEIEAALCELPDLGPQKSTESRFSGRFMGFPQALHRVFSGRQRTEETSIFTLKPFRHRLAILKSKGTGRIATYSDAHPCKGDCMKPESDYTELLRLWMHRILGTPKARSRLVRRSSFRDDDVAEFLGLEKWIDAEGAAFSPAEIKRELKILHNEVETRAASIQLPLLIQKNFQHLSRFVQIKPSDQQILAFLVLREHESVMADAVNVLTFGSVSDYVGAIARALKLRPNQVAAALSPKGELVQSGLVKMMEKRRSAPKVPAFFSPRVAASLLTDGFDRDNLLRDVVIPVAPPTLSYRDYPHLRETLNLLRIYLRRMLREGSKGVNILIHGAPGTGKSELARVLARDLRCGLYELSSEDWDGNPIEPPKRLDALRAANTLIGKRSLLVFDEAEDVFRSGSSFAASLVQTRKAWMHRMLETNKVPTLWISNSIDRIDSANVRRFDFVFEVSVPPRRQRLRILQNICPQTISQKMINGMANIDELAPAVVARAAHVIQSTEKHVPTKAHDSAFERLIHNTLKAQGKTADLKKAEHLALPPGYDITCLNCEIDLLHLGLALQKNPTLRLCLYGPPGTGKTSFAHWLAHETDRPIHVKSASDILSPYLGQTEQNLARAFAAAEDEGALLLMDEVDTFLQDRHQARCSWEISQVNELLTQVERFRGPFIASTNLMGNLDPASLRRFDLKLFFDYLLPDQATRLFKSHCRRLGLGRPTKNALDRLSQFTSLTPGDFATVTRQHRFRLFPGPEDFLNALREECQHKPISGKIRLGFL